MNGMYRNIFWNAGSSRSRARSMAYFAASKRLLVGGVGPGVAAEHVAGELVEHDDERQAALRLLAPGVQLSRRRPLVEVAEAVRHLAVEGLVLLEPLVSELAVAGLALPAEPEGEDVRGATLHA
jgi:hypothetical protein